MHISLLFRYWRIPDSCFCHQYVVQKNPTLLSPIWGMKSLPFSRLTHQSGECRFKNPTYATLVCVDRSIRLSHSRSHESSGGQPYNVLFGLGPLYYPGDELTIVWKTSRHRNRAIWERFEAFGQQCSTSGAVANGSRVSGYSWLLYLCDRLCTGTMLAWFFSFYVQIINHLSLKGYARLHCGISMAFAVY